MTPNRPLGLAMSPAVLNTVGQALDLAWLEIAGNYGPEATRTARDRLARIILANPLCEDTTAEVLKRAGLASMAAAERGRGSASRRTHRAQRDPQ
jgi:hypothetical protein